MGANDRKKSEPVGEQFLDTTKQKVSYIEKHHTVGDVKSVVEFQQEFVYNSQIWPSLADLGCGMNAANGSYSGWQKKSEPKGEQSLDTTKCFGTGI